MKSPAFRDPIYDGAADPIIIKNEQTDVWYIFYTQRHATEAKDGNVAYCHGTKIGVAEYDKKRDYWYYRGALDLEFEFGTNTFWAPEIVWDKASGLYHMFVTYIRGVHETWAGDACIRHYTSTDLFKWHHEGRVDIGSHRIIDPCLFPLPDGGWRMWYKNEVIGAHTCYADSKDLFHFTDVGQTTYDHPQEGPNVFEFGGRYYLICCENIGLSVYVSDDLTHFTRQNGERLLSHGGKRYLDGAVGRHADVIVSGEHAYIVYFVHYNDPPEGAVADTAHRAPTVVQFAELKIEDGKLVCDRDADFSLMLDGET